MAITAEYGSSAPMANVTAVVVRAMAVATGREPDNRCQSGTRMHPDMVKEMRLHG